MKKTLLNILKIIFFFGAGLTILYFLYQNQNEKWMEECANKGEAIQECGTLVDKIIQDFKEVNYFWIFMVLLAFMISNVSRAARWIMLIKPLGYTPRGINAFLCTMLGYFASLGFPRIGEVVRPTTFVSYEKIPLEKVMGTIVTDRITDVLSLLVVIVLAFLLEFDKLWGFLTDRMNEMSGEEGGIPVLIQVFFVLGLIGLAVLFWAYKNWDKVSEYKIIQKGLNILLGFWEGILTIRKIENPGWYVFHSINIWFMYFLMTYLGFFAYEPTAELGATAGLVIFIAGAFGMLFPSPGGMGSYNAFLTIALVSLYGIDGNNAFSFSIILFFSIQIGCNVLFGLLALLGLPIINRNYNPEINV